MAAADHLSAFIMAGLALTGSPGPATLSLAAAGAAFGLRRSIGLAAGIIAGVLAVMLATATGLSGLLLAQPILGPVVKVLAAAYIVYLAWCIATAPALDDAARPARVPTFLQGVFLGVGNPKAYVAMAALFSGFVLHAHAVVTDVMLKSLILVAMMVVVDLAWLLAGAMLARAMRRPRLNRAINIAFAVALVASVAIGFV
jgi:threonine/homoserine/homoserine lactone efflux protein